MCHKPPDAHLFSVELRENADSFYKVLWVFLPGMDVSKLEAEQI